MIYEWVTDEMFNDELEKIIEERGVEILNVPGVYEVLSEHFNNDVLERLERCRKIELGEGVDDEG